MMEYGYVRISWDKVVISIELFFIERLICYKGIHVKDVKDNILR